MPKQGSGKKRKRGDKPKKRVVTLEFSAAEEAEIEQLLASIDEKLRSLNAYYDWSEAQRAAGRR